MASLEVILGMVEVWGRREDAFPTLRDPQYPLHVLEWG